MLPATSASSIVILCGILLIVTTPYMYSQAVRQPHTFNTASLSLHVPVGVNRTPTQTERLSNKNEGNETQRRNAGQSKSSPLTSILCCMLVFVTDGISFALGWSVSSPSSPASFSFSGTSTCTARCIRSRRDAISDLLASPGIHIAASVAIGALDLLPQPGNAAIDSMLHRSNFHYRSDWTGTALPLLSIEDAAATATTNGAGTEGEILYTFRMGRWPDPILRRPASPIRSSLFGTPELHIVARALRATAREEGAVGLAAQQCGVDGRLLWIDTTASGTKSPERQRRQQRQARGEGTATGTAARNSILSSDEGLFLVNPRITWRTSELEMLPWTETCLVLPPSFTATVLRDAAITVQYESLDGETRSTDLDGELARCVQHESDHDRGILILDHVDLSEMEGGANGVMAALESDGHGDRMLSAYGRYIDESSSVS